MIYALAIALLAVSAPTDRIWVETSSATEAVELKRALVELLAVELSTSAIAARPEEARLIVALQVDGDAMLVEARDASGADLVERSISLSGGSSAALRVAVLLVREAREVLAELPANVVSAEPAPAEPEPVLMARLPPEQPPPVEPAQNYSLEAGPTISMLTWNTPFAPQLAVGALVQYRVFDALRVGISVALNPLPTVRETSDVSVDAREVLALAGGELTVFTLGALSFGVSAELGADFIDGDARALVFDGTAAPGPVSQENFVAAVALVLRLSVFDRLDVRLHAGPRFLFGEGAIGVDEAFGGPREPATPGIAAFFGGLSLSFKIF